jgi:hypothetical protein
MLPMPLVKVEPPGYCADMGWGARGKRGPPRASNCRRMAYGDKALAQNNKTPAGSCAYEAKVSGVLWAEPGAHKLRGIACPTSLFRIRNFGVIWLE